MSIQKKSNKSLSNRISTRENFIGLAQLNRVLERDFFADATVEYTMVSPSTIELVIHLKCNFGLTESLFHLNNGNWGNFKNTLSGDVKTSPFHSTLLELEKKNAKTVEIKELSFHLRDTSIVISRLPNLAIEDNVEKILNAVSAHFVYFTRGLTKMPYEIFVPIYEETENNFNRSEKKHNTRPDYLEFWGLYFEGEADSSVYDVKNKSIIEESDFFLLNQWE